MLPAPPPAFPAAVYYSALASLVPLVWLALVFQAKINQDPWPDHVRDDVFGVLVYSAIQLVGLVGLPVMEYGVLLTLRDQQPRWWVEQYVGPFMIVSVGQIVVPVVWHVVQQALPERWRPRIARWGSAALGVSAFVYVGGWPL